MLLNVKTPFEERYLHEFSGWRSACHADDAEDLKKDEKNWLQRRMLGLSLTLLQPQPKNDCLRKSSYFFLVEVM